VLKHRKHGQPEQKEKVNMNNLTVFEFESQEVRVLTREGEPWFVAKDLCSVLDIKNSRDALSRLDADEKVELPYKTVVGLTDDPNTTRLSAVSESGMYALVLSSRKPSAKSFRKWVTSEVLPTIRKTGSYSTNTPAPQNCDCTAPQFIARKLNGYVVEQRIADGYINATAVSYAYQQLPGYRREVQNWLRHKATQELMQQISAPLFIPPVGLYQITNGTVWLHPALVVNFAFWTSKEIGPIVEKWVEEWNSNLVPNQPTNKQLEAAVTDSFRRIEDLRITLDSLWERWTMKDSAVEKLSEKLDKLVKDSIKTESQTVQEIGELQLKVEGLEGKLSNSWGQIEGFAEMMQRVEKLLEEQSSNGGSTVTVNVSTALPSLDAREVIWHLINDYSARTNVGQMQCWQKLYREFSHRYHVCIDQCRQNKKQSKLEVVEGMGMIRELYGIAAEMFA
jgi:prophage antirepressor-like protein